MPRPRKPTNVLELSGAFKKNPQRAAARAHEPIVDGELGPRPKGLNAKERYCWDRLVKLAPAGVLKSSDEVIVELTARLWAKVKSGAATAAEGSQLKLCLQQLGMTPAARSQVSVPPVIPANPFAAA